MTNREFFAAVANGVMNDEIAAKAQEMLEKALNEAEHRKSLDAVRRAKKNAEKAVEDAPIREAIVGVMDTFEFKTAKDLIVAAEVDVSVQKLARLVKPLIEDGTIIKGKVAGEKGKVVGYKLA